MSHLSGDKIAFEMIWESHKNKIQQLYLSEDITLTRLRDIMKDSHNFDASKAQYERHFKQWGFRKNLTSREWKAVGHHLGKRKREGRDSDLYAEGVLIPKKKWQKETARNGFISEWEKHAQAPSPKMPVGMLIRSPTPSVLHTFSIENIPWFRYRSILESQVSELQRLSTSYIFRADPCKDDEDLGAVLNLGVAFRSAGEALIAKMQNGITTADFDSVKSRMLAIMPESHPGEHEDLLQNLLGLYNQDAMKQLVYTMIYFVSNNLPFLAKNVTRSLTEWLLLQENFNVLQYLLSIKGPTAEALAETLFSVAVEAGNLKAVKIFLHTGLNPDSSRVIGDCTPLQYASRKGNIELVRVLLGAGAQVNATSSRRYPGFETPLQLAVEADNTELVNILLVAGARVDMVDEDGWSALHIAAINGSTEVAQLLIDEGADVNSMTKNGETPLHIAVKGPYIRTVRLLIFRLLISAGADIDITDGRHRTVLECAAMTSSVELVSCILDADPEEMGSAVAIAAQSNDIEIIKILLDAGADIDGVSKNFMTPLTVAILYRNVELAIYLLKAGADINGWKPDVYISQMTPLQAALYQDNTEVARMLLDAGADVNTPASTCPSLVNNDSFYESLNERSNKSSDKESYETICFPGTALQTAIYRRNHELTNVLLQYGADVNAAASKLRGRTALQAAVAIGDYKLTEYLIDASADVNDQPGTCEGLTALTAAVENGDFSLFLLLLDAGAHVNNPSAILSGGTALEAAVKSKNDKLIQYLLNIGADPHDSTALLKAVVDENVGLVQILLSAHRIAHPLGKESYGCAALQVAVKNEHFEIVQVLLAAGIDVNISPLLSHQAGDRLEMIDHGISALCNAVIKKSVSLVRILLEAGADTNLMGADGKTPLLHAVYQNNISLVQILLEAGANVNTCGELEFGRTPLQLAAEEGNIDISDVLLKTGAEVNAAPYRNGGLTALQGAAIGGYFEIARKLLNAKAEVNASSADQNGRTALEGAAEHGRIDILQLLLDAGAEVEGTGRRQYDRALHLAAQNGHYAVRKLLQSYYESQYGISNSTGKSLPPEDRPRLDIRRYQRDVRPWLDEDDGEIVYRL